VADDQHRVAGGRRTSFVGGGFRLDGPRYVKFALAIEGRAEPLSGGLPLAGGHAVVVGRRDRKTCAFHARRYHFSSLRRTSALLRQPGGFEGFCVAQVVLGAEDLAAPEGHERPDFLVEPDASRPGGQVDMTEDEDRLAGVPDLLNPNRETFSGPAPRVVPGLSHGVPGLEGAPSGFDVLPRHRPPSISRPSAAHRAGQGPRRRSI
jgi:hypothetical protein